MKGGDGGHRGVRSVMEAFASDDFTRIRVGVGAGGDASGERYDVVDHVLGRFAPDEVHRMEEVLGLVREAIVTFCGTAFGRDEPDSTENEYSIIFR